jgi:hypothetical protein
MKVIRGLTLTCQATGSFKVMAVHTIPTSNFPFQ